MQVEYVTGPSGYGGVNTYAEELYSHLKKGFSISIKRNTVKSILGLAILKKRTISAEITHFTNQEIASPIVMKNKFNVITVHDLTVKKLDLFKYSPSKWAVLAAKIYDYKLKSLKKANAVIAVSENTKNDLVAELAVAENSIKVIYEAAHPSFKVITGVVKRKNTLLYVGNELPHKNLSNLLKAISLVKKSVPDIKLVKIGQPGWPGVRENLLCLADKLKIRDSIEFKEEVVDLVREYNSASAFVFPSLYEGFGLPILEAMACGCPVIASNRSSIPEVAGKAALYSNPENPVDMAEKILALLSNTTLEKKLVKNGLIRCQQFSWGKCAEETMAIYQDLLTD